MYPNCLLSLTLPPISLVLPTTHHLHTQPPPMHVQVSAVIRGSPTEVLRVLMDPHSATTILGPALEVQTALSLHAHAGRLFGWCRHWALLFSDYACTSMLHRSQGTKDECQQCPEACQELTHTRTAASNDTAATVAAPTLLMPCACRWRCWTAHRANRCESECLRGCVRVCERGVSVCERSECVRCVGCVWEEWVCECSVQHSTISQM